MKIVFLTQYFPPEMGAPQSRIFETVKGFQDSGAEIIVLTAMPNYPTGKIFDRYRGKFSVDESFEGINIRRYWLYSSNSKKTLPRIISMLSFSIIVLLSVLKVRKFKPDFFITESPPLTLGLSGYILSVLSGAKHIMNVSDIWPLSAFELGAIKKGFTYNFLEGIERFLYRRSFACSGQSQQIIDWIKTHGSKKVHLYRNGVDIERFDSLRNTINKLKTKNLKIVYAGLLGVAQGIYDLCQNIDFASLGAELHIYGEGSEKNEVEEYLKNNNNRGIYLHPVLQRKDVPAVLFEYDITLIPLVKKIYGAIPSKIYEAMAAELPIIFTGGGEGAEIVNEYKIGWICEPSDYEEIKKTIKIVSALNSNELGEIKSNCLYAAQNIFNRKTQINSFYQFINN